MSAVTLKRSVSLLVCLVLAGCVASTTVKNKSEPRPPFTEKDGAAFYYRCDKGPGFPARITESKMIIELEDGTHILEPEPVASGFQYSRGKTNLRGQGDEADLYHDSQHYKCRIDRRKSVWEDARYRGADFIAMGNEPGWKLELSREGDILYIGNYGTVSFRIATPMPSHPNQYTQVFVASGRGHNLQLTVKNTPCVDTMKGDRFDNSVSLVVDGNTLTGCGMILTPLYHTSHLIH